MNSCHEEGVRDRNRAGIQLDSGREHPPRDISSSEPGHCYGSIKAAYPQRLSAKGDKVQDLQQYVLADAVEFR
eukprot:gene16663-biopygen4706